ncbi:MAG: pyridoxal phosphate-dependent decarboxylase family protein, partial [Saprospiraceae bacterium]
MKPDFLNFQQKGHELIDLLSDYYKNIEKSDFPVTVERTPAEMLEHWQADFQKTPNDVTEYFEDILKNSIQVNHPNFIGHQVAAPLPIHTLVNALLTSLNNSIAIYEMGAAGLAMEKIVADYFIKQFEFGKSANGIFVSGGSIGNLTALLAARQAKAGYDAWTEGNLGDLAVMVSEEAHYCVSRATQSMGFGADGVIKIPTDSQLKIIPEQLDILYQKAKQAGKKVIAVVGNGCSTSTGTYDNLEVMADFCEANNLWFHVDGAHGAPAILSKKYKSLLKGAERADSIVMDFHKMLLTPALTTIVLFKNGQTSAEAFSQKADYLLEQTQEWYQGANRTLECTRPMMSVRAYTLLKYYGGDYLENYITRMYDLGQYFAQKIIAHPQFELATLPDCNIVCFRFLPKSDKEINQLNYAIRKTLQEEGEFYMVQTVVKGRAFLRITIINQHTTEVHLDRL